jgi:hypothetical protein
MKRSGSMNSASSGMQTTRSVPTMPGFSHPSSASLVYRSGSMTSGHHGGHLHGYAHATVPVDAPMPVATEPSPELPYEAHAARLSQQSAQRGASEAAYPPPPPPLPPPQQQQQAQQQQAESPGITGELAALQARCCQLLDMEMSLVEDSAELNGFTGELSNAGGGCSGAGALTREIYGGVAARAAA